MNVLSFHDFLLESRRRPGSVSVSVASTRTYRKPGPPGHARKEVFFTCVGAPRCFDLRLQGEVAIRVDVIAEQYPVLDVVGLPCCASWNEYLSDLMSIGW